MARRQAVRCVARGGDYFRIWIADLFFMMLTLGLYWPWMRRHRWQFLDANTWVGPHCVANPHVATQPGAWPPRRQQVLVGLLIICLWLFITRPRGILGWPLLAGLITLTGPFWLVTEWRGRLAQLSWRGASPHFTGTYATASLLWLRIALPVIPAGLLIGALFMDNFRLWLLGNTFTERYGLSDGLRAWVPWIMAFFVALSLATACQAVIRFGLSHIRHPQGHGRCRLLFWPVLRAALVSMVLILPAPFLAIGLGYANWPVLLSLLSIEPDGTLENLANLAPGADSLFGGLKLDISVLDGSVLTDGGLCVSCRATVVIALLLGCVLLLRMGWRYFATRLWNLSWNGFRVSGYAFESHLAAGRVMATGFFCDVLTLLTLGLYYPLGVVRMARLRRESLWVVAITAPLGDTEAGQGAGVSGTSATSGATGTASASGMTRVSDATGVPGVSSASGTSDASGASGTMADAAPRPVAVPEPRMHWTLALGMMLTPVVFAVWALLYGKLVMSEWLVRAMPSSLDEAVGEATLELLKQEGVRPSALPAQTQTRLREGLMQAADRAWDAGVLPPYRIEFVHGGEVLGPNAITLPGNIILITDELLSLASRQPNREAVLLGVVGHELAHVLHQDPQRILLLASLRKSLTMVFLGRGETDLLASGANTVLYQGYANSVRQAADQGSIRMLQASGHDPAVMIPFLQALEQARFDRPDWMVAAQRVPIGLAAQPVDQPRLQVFRSHASP